MNKFTLSTFLAFMLAKLTSLNTKFNKTEIENDSLSSILNSTNSIFDTLHINDIQAIEFTQMFGGFGHGFSGTEHIINYLLTYIPVFYIIIVIVSTPTILITIFNKLKHRPTIKNEEGKKEAYNDFFMKQINNQESDKEANTTNISKERQKRKEFNPNALNLFLRIALNKDYKHFAN
jgi:hypothetical protein